jgi:hypothetical protein
VNLDSALTRAGNRAERQAAVDNLFARHLAFARPSAVGLPIRSVP